MDALIGLARGSVRVFSRLAFVIAIAAALPGCPIAANLRGIGTGNKPAAAVTAPEPEQSGAQYVYACADAEDPDAPLVRAHADDRDGAVDQCVSELRRRRGQAASVSCRCRLEGNAQLGPRRM